MSIGADKLTETSHPINPCPRTQIQQKNKVQNAAFVFRWQSGRSSSVRVKVNVQLGTCYCCCCCCCYFAIFARLDWIGTSPAVDGNRRILFTLRQSPGGVCLLLKRRNNGSRDKIVAVRAWTRSRNNAVLRSRLDDALIFPALSFFGD